MTAGSLCWCQHHEQASDPAGTISRADQQPAGAAYLTALMRYAALGDATMRPNLTGAQPMEGLNALSIQVQAQGFIAPPPVIRPTGMLPLSQ